MAWNRRFFNLVLFGGLAVVGVGFLRQRTWAPGAPGLMVRFGETAGTPRRSIGLCPARRPIPPRSQCYENSDAPVLQDHVVRPRTRASRRCARLERIRRFTRPPVSDSIMGASFSQAVLTALAPIASRTSYIRCITRKGPMGDSVNLRTRISRAPPPSLLRIGSTVLASFNKDSLLESRMFSLILSAVHFTVGL